METTASSLPRDISTLLLSDNQFDFLPDEYVNDPSLRQKVMDEIYALPLRYQMALLIHYYLGFHIYDMAYVLNINFVQAKSSLVRSEAMLKGRIERLMGKQLPFVQVCDDAEPVLAKLYRADEREEITPDIKDRLSSFVENLV